MDYQDIEITLRTEAKAIAAQGGEWPARDVAKRLQEIADLLTKIRNEHQGVINASMGKRSGTKIDM